MPVRAERATDVVNISAVHCAAFPTELEARLVDALRSAGRLSVSLVAVERDSVVGHIAFSPVSIETFSGSIIGQGLAPVAVIPEHQKRGIGAKLIGAGIEQCRLMGAPFVVVLGEPGYYQRFGFTPAHVRGIGNEYNVHDEFMIMELRLGGIPSGIGMARYGEEFSLVA